jgi:hypothetical protein
MSAPTQDHYPRIAGGDLGQGLVKPDTQAERDAIAPLGPVERDNRQRVLPLGQHCCHFCIPLRLSSPLR